jgi:hypothetical protein
MGGEGVADRGCRPPWGLLVPAVARYTYFDVRNQKMLCVRQVENMFGRNILKKLGHGLLHCSAAKNSKVDSQQPPEWFPTLFCSYVGGQSGDL